ncbi:hypothetical protein ONS95_014631 [Cadophora gregata]|uniref:uncharacterized protein n=1 Tax=Cadophora gregata TaxID=51156 RepID=UPI0026DD1A0C|nr:uncharacterized protein ONS95_014631 [Cadophora gregata]KAK0112910.1 hypothetical protein ONS95_014631 [Cadophora gregata]KAK0125035.1 hypothetical protein ONS96_008903 [Cadophora gregata f. sp. sojae]
MCFDVVGEYQNSVESTFTFRSFLPKITLAVTVSVNPLMLASVMCSQFLGTFGNSAHVYVSDVPEHNFNISDKLLRPETTQQHLDQHDHRNGGEACTRECRVWSSTSIFGHLWVWHFYARRVLAYHRKMRHCRHTNTNSTSHTDSSSRTSEVTTDNILEQQTSNKGRRSTEIALSTVSITNSNDVAAVQLLSTPMAYCLGGKYQQLPTTSDLAPSASTSDPSIGLQCRVNSTTPDKFTLFPRMPAELRLRVWTEAYPEPRLIEIRVERGGIWSVRCSTKLSSLFVVCHESRTEVFKRHLSISRHLHSAVTIPFDGEKDVLVFRRDGYSNWEFLSAFSNYHSLEITHSIRRIVWEDKSYTRRVSPFCLTDLFRFRDLKGILRMPNLKTVQIAKFNARQDACVVVGCVETPASEEYQKKKARMKADMDAMLQGYRRDYASQKSNDTANKSIEVTIGELVLADWKS